MSATPDAAVVRFAAWAAWATAGYLIAGLAAGVLSGWLRRVGRLRRACGPVAGALARGVALGLVALGLGATAAVAGEGHGTTRARPAAGRFDWAHPTAAGRVVVRPGDSLWRISERALPPATPAAQIALTWPRWWTANRTVVGPDPDL